jgi:heme/copper-type cytochrome/quinol oxidase subunit 1
VKGSLSFEPAMLFAVGFIWVFTIGGFSGLILSFAPIDIQVQDTYYMVGHFHYVLVAGSLFLGLAGMPRRYADYAVQFTDSTWSRPSVRGCSA